MRRIDDVRVDVERRLDARVPELLLRDLHRHAQIVEQRRMNVAELMPRHAPEPARSAAGCSTRSSSFDSRRGSPDLFGNTRSSALLRVDRSRCAFSDAIACGPMGRSREAIRSWSLFQSADRVIVWLRNTALVLALSVLANLIFWELSK